MVRVASVVTVLPFFADAARVSMHARTDSFIMHETVALANGLMGANATGANRMAAKDCPWSKQFETEYSNHRVVGSGATACVYLAEDSTGATVALKVGKGGEGESLSLWKNECREMQLLRVRACASNKKPRFADGTVYKLNQQYVPTCLEVGSYPEDNINFYIMHAAGTKIIKSIENSEYTNAQRKSLFAQFVASVYAMHALDTSHNDLHGGNIVIDDSGAEPQLALIDFGEIVAPLDPTMPGQGARQTWLVDYKRDGNAIWAYSSLLAKCPSFPNFPVMPASHTELHALKEKFLACMESEWGASVSDIAAMRKVCEKDIEQSPDQGIENLFKTKLVQDNLPKFNDGYKWKQTAECDSWDAKQIQSFEREVTYKAMFRCDTLPTYMKSRIAKSGKVKTSKQCLFAQSACYSTIKDVTWGCDAALIKGSPCDSVALPANAGHPDTNFEGGCITPLNTEAYNYAAPWE